MHFHIKCVYYIRTHPYRAYVERETGHQERKRNLDVVDVIVDVAVVVVDVAGVGVGVVVVVDVATTIANFVVENRTER